MNILLDPKHSASHRQEGNGLFCHHKKQFGCHLPGLHVASSAPLIGLFTLYPRASSKSPSAHSTGHSLGALVAKLQLEVYFTIQIGCLHIAQVSTV